MTGETLGDKIKQEFRSGSKLNQLLLINTIVFIILAIILALSNLTQSGGLYNVLLSILSLPGEPGEILFQPWSIITNLFVHKDLSHFFWNMLMLYLIGRLFITLFSENRLVTTYLLGGIFGGLLHVLAYQIFPLLIAEPHYGVIGASGSIYALIGAILYFRPTTKVQLLLLRVEIPFWLIAGLFLIGDLTALDAQDGVARFAHIGGAIFGVLSVLNIQNSKQFMNRLTRYWSNKNWRNPFKQNKRFKVYKNEDYKRMSDDEYRSVKKDNQEKVNAILDKISKGGYDGLSKAEKEFLFKYGNDA